MSLWPCDEHGLVGTEACCPQASRASLSEISASVPPEPPTLSDEPRAGRRRNTALPPIGDVSPHLCYECGGAHPLVVREKRVARWGQGPEVETVDEWYRCPNCGDGYYTFEQAQASERALWLATIAALRAEVSTVAAHRDAALMQVKRLSDENAALRAARSASDGVAIAVAMADTGTRFVLEPEQLELVEPSQPVTGVPQYVPSGDAQPARVGDQHAKSPVQSAADLGRDEA